ncbi:MAG: metalloregulator ArsR/SmtB family transcription factor [Ilumatobacteraceae bacterium]|nr:metalloregulator ArsR/SmtB family transcription factor [Ilumatobacteraceae bacterium]
MSFVANDDGFRALASPTRRTLLRLVRDEAQPVGALAEQLAISQPAVSQHLAVLRDAGLVSVEPDGRRRLYRADTDALLELRGYFDGYWSDAVDRLADVAERAARQRQAAS